MRSSDVELYHDSDTMNRGQTYSAQNRQDAKGELTSCNIAPARTPPAEGVLVPHPFANPAVGQLSWQGLCMTRLASSAGGNADAAWMAATDVTDVTDDGTAADDWTCAVR